MIGDAGTRTLTIFRVIIYFPLFWTIFFLNPYVYITMIKKGVIRNEELRVEGIRSWKKKYNYGIIANDNYKGSKKKSLEHFKEWSYQIFFFALTIQCAKVFSHTLLININMTKLSKVSYFNMYFTIKWLNEVGG